MRFKICRLMVTGGVALAGILVLCVALGCAGAPPAQKAPEAPPAAATQLKASIVLDPQVASTTAAAVVVYGSGFEPGKAVLIRLAGTWKYEEKERTMEVVAPPLSSAVPNDYGAFALRGGDAPSPRQLVTYYKLKAGVYTLIAEQNRVVVASAPLVLTAPPPPKK